MQKDIKAFIIDDNPIDQFVFKRMVEPYRLFDSIYSIQDPLKLFLVAEKYSEQQKVFFVDYNMPMMSGFEVIQNLATRKLTERVKVIVLTSSEEIQEIKKELKDFPFVLDVISKPFDISKVMKIKQQLVYN